MKNLLFLFALLSIAFIGCNSESDETTAQATNETEQVSPDLINNPNTADETNTNSNTNADADGAAPVMTFEKTTHNFGKIKQGEVVQTEFEFTNTGNADLIISNAKADCGCTVPTYPKHPIKPGETASIPVEYNSSGKSNQQTKQIHLTANTNPSQTTLQIEVFIEAE